MKHPPQKVTLGLLQQACEADPAANLAYAREAVTKAARSGAQIICMQELFAHQYFAQSEDHGNFSLAEPIPGPSTEAFQQIAREEKVVIIASLFEKRAVGLYHNTAAIIDADGSLLGGTGDIQARLSELDIDAVTWADWQRLDAWEIEEGKKRDKLRYKLSSIDEMLTVIRELR